MVLLLSEQGETLKCQSHFSYYRPTKEQARTVEHAVWLYILCIFTVHVHVQYVHVQNVHVQYVFVSW